MGKLFFDQTRPKVGPGGLKIGDTVRLRNCGEYDGMTGRAVVYKTASSSWVFEVVERRGDWPRDTFDIHLSSIKICCNIINEEQ